LLIVPSRDPWAHALILLSDWNILEGVDLFFADYLPEAIEDEAPNEPSAAGEPSQQPIYSWYLGDLLSRGAYIALSAEAPAFQAVPSLLPFWSAQCLFPAYLPEEMEPHTLHLRISSLSDWVFQQFVPQAHLEKPEVVFCYRLLQALEAAPAGYATNKELSLYRAFRALPDLHAARQLLNPLMPPNRVNISDLEGSLHQHDPRHPRRCNLEASTDGGVYPISITDGNRFQRDANLVQMRFPDQEALLNAAEQSHARCSLALCPLPRITDNQEGQARVTRIYVMTLPTQVPDQPDPRAGQIPRHPPIPFMHAFQLAALVRHALYIKDYLVAWQIRGTCFIACFDVLGEVQFHPNLFHFGSQVLGANRTPVSYFDESPANITNTEPKPVPSNSGGSEQKETGKNKDRSQDKGKGKDQDKLEFEPTVEGNARHKPIQDNHRTPTDFQRKFAKHYVITNPIEDYNDEAIEDKRPDNYCQLLTQTFLGTVNRLFAGPESKQKEE
jgi:hypothetical protein